MNNTDQTVVQAPKTFEPSKVWRPIRPTAPINPTDDRINQLQGKIAKITDSLSGLTVTVADTTGSNPITPVNAPAQVTGVSAAVTAKNINGALMCVLDVSFTPHANFAAAQLWITGYNGNTAPQLLTQGFSSPIEYAAQITNELVTLTVVALNSGNVAADFSTAPTAVVLLNGASTAPPAPTINQGLVALGGGTGWQFSFSPLNGLLADVIQGYWIYRDTVHVTPTGTSARFQFIPQPPSTLPYTFQDITGSTYFYWVSAVSVSGLESPLSDATSVDVITPYYPTTTGTTGTPFANPSFAYDGNAATSSSSSVAGPSGSAGSAAANETWSDFPAGPTAVTITNVVLEVLSYASINNQGAAILEYSLDGGSSWTTFYSISSTAGGVANAANQYYTATLSIAQDPTLIQVRATLAAATVPTSFDSHGTPIAWSQGVAVQNIYEARVSVTYH
jgi:hypothetical protein